MSTANQCSQCFHVFCNRQALNNHTARRVCERKATAQTIVQQPVVAQINNEDGFHHLREYPSDNLPRIGFNFDSDVSSSDRYYYDVATANEIEIPLPEGNIRVDQWTNFFSTFHQLRTGTHAHPIRCIVRDVERNGNVVMGHNIYQFADRDGNLIMNDGQTDLVKRLFWQISYAVNLKIIETILEDDKKKKSTESKIEHSTKLWMNHNTFMSNPDSFKQFKHAILGALLPPLPQTEAQKLEYQLAKLHLQQQLIQRIQPDAIIACEPTRPSMASDPDGLLGYQQYVRDTTANKEPETD